MSFPAADISLSIIIPAYNEEKNICDAVTMIQSWLATNISDYEIIIVDDGSSDSTGEIIRTLADTDKKIRLITHDVNHGKGAALTSGFLQAGKEWILFTDADLQIPAAELERFLPLTGQNDCIIGFRQGRRDPLTRRFFSLCYALIIRYFLEIAFDDINCPFKLIRKSVLKPDELHSNGFFIDTELMFRLSRRNCHIHETGVACQPRQKGESTVRFHHVVETVSELRSLLKRVRSEARRTR